MTASPACQLRKAGAAFWHLANRNRSIHIKKAGLKTGSTVEPPVNPLTSKFPCA